MSYSHTRLLAEENCSIGSFVWCRYGDPPGLGREGEWVFFSWQDQLAEEVVCTLFNRERSPPSVLQVRSYAVVHVVSSMRPEAVCCKDKSFFLLDLTESIIDYVQLM